MQGKRRTNPGETSLLLCGLACSTKVCSISLPIARKFLNGLHLPFAAHEYSFLAGRCPSSHKTSTEVSILLVYVHKYLFIYQRKAFRQLRKLREWRYRTKHKIPVILRENSQARFHLLRIRHGFRFPIIFVLSWQGEPIRP